MRDAAFNPIIYRRIWNVLFLLITPIVVISGYWWTNDRLQAIEDEWRRAMLNQAVSIARTIDPEKARTLSFTSADLELTEFDVLQRQLIEYQAVSGHPGIYTLALRDGDLRFGPTSFSEDEARALPPGATYENPMGRN